MPNVFGYDEPTATAAPDAPQGNVFGYVEPKANVFGHIETLPAPSPVYTMGGNRMEDVVRDQSRQRIVNSVRALQGPSGLNDATLNALSDQELTQRNNALHTAASQQADTLIKGGQVDFDKPSQTPAEDLAKSRLLDIAREHVKDNPVEFANAPLARGIATIPLAMRTEATKYNPQGRQDAAMERAIQIARNEQDPFGQQISGAVGQLLSPEMVAGMGLAAPVEGASALANYARGVGAMTGVQNTEQAFRGEPITPLKSGAINTAMLGTGALGEGVVGKALGGAVGNLAATTGVNALEGRDTSDPEAAAALVAGVAPGIIHGLQAASYPEHVRELIKNGATIPEAHAKAKEITRAEEAKPDQPTPSVPEPASVAPEAVKETPVAVKTESEPSNTSESQNLTARKPAGDEFASSAKHLLDQPNGTHDFVDPELPNYSARLTKKGSHIIATYTNKKTGSDLSVIISADGLRNGVFHLATPLYDDGIVPTRAAQNLINLAVRNGMKVEFEPGTKAQQSIAEKLDFSGQIPITESEAPNAVRQPSTEIQVLQRPETEEVRGGVPGRDTIGQETPIQSRPEEEKQAGSAVKSTGEDAVKSSPGITDAIGQHGLSAGPPGAIQIGRIKVPTTVADFKGAWNSLVGAVRHLRERFSPIEGNFGPDVAKSFIKTVAAPSPEARTITSSFARRAFEGSPDPKQSFSDFMDLARYYRLRDLKARNPNGGVGQGLPDLPPAEVARLEADPHIQKAMALWNNEISPMLEDIRNRNGMIMNPNAGDRKIFPVFANLPTEFEGPVGTDTSVNPSFAFNRKATGNKQLLMDPQEAMEAIVRGHLATDYKQQLVGVLKSRYSVPAAGVVPSGRRGFTGTFRGSPIDVQPVDLAPADAKVPDIHYLPSQIAHEYNNIRQDRGQYNTLFDKAIQAGTKAAVIGDFSPHAARVIAHVAARQAQSGQSISGLLPSWLGSNEAAARRMLQMTKSPIGETMQLLIDRSGSDKGAGFDVKPGQSRLSQWLGKPHDLLFNPENGIDPMARRAIADAHLRTLFGNDFMDHAEARINSGRYTPAEGAHMLESQMSDAEFIGLGRKVNGTMGFANKQTRSNLLNWASRVFPFISSESGMIPREITKIANLDIPAGVKAVQRGDYKQALLQMGGMLATGAIGTYLGANALNYANTKAQTGTGKFLWDNDDGHKLDVWIAPGWHLSNLDPTFSRGTRLAGMKGWANGDGWMKSAAMEGINEPLSMLAKTLQIAWTAASTMAGKTSALHFQTDSHNGNISAMPTTLTKGLNVPVVTNTANAAAEGNPLLGPAIQDTVRAVTGTQLSRDSNTSSGKAPKADKLPKLPKAK